MDSVDHILAGEQIFVVSTTSRLYLRSPQLQVHVAHGVKCLWQEGSHSCLSSAKMNGGPGGPVLPLPPYGFTVWYLIKHKEGSVQ